MHQKQGNCLQSPLLLYLSWWRQGICCAGKVLGSWWCSGGMMKLFWCKKWTSPHDILGKEQTLHIRIRSQYTHHLEIHNKLECRNIRPPSVIPPTRPVLGYANGTRKTTSKNEVDCLDMEVSNTSNLSPSLQQDYGFTGSNRLIKGCFH